MNIQILVKAGFAALSLIAGVAFSQPHAGGSIKLVVGFPAGGAPDAVARTFADQLRQTAGVTVIVENRPGASGKIAIDALLSSPANGETMALIPSSILALTPMIVKTARYDSAKDFTTLANVGEYGFGIAAGPLSGSTTLSSFKTWAKAHPRESSFATPGTGTPQHFLGSQLQKALGVELLHVPYKGGAPALTDVVGGQVSMLITTEQLLVPHEGKSKIKTLLVTSKQRNPKMPSVPTATEAGIPELEATDWFGVFVRSSTPPEEVRKWQSLFATVVASTKYREMMSALGYSTPSKQAPDFAKILQDEKAAWAQRVKISNFLPEE